MNAGIGEIGMVDLLTVQQYLAQAARRVDPRGGIRRLDRAQHMNRASGVAVEFTHRACNCLCNRLEAHLLARDRYAVLGNEDILGRCTHLPGKQRQGEGHISTQALQIVEIINHDGVHTGLFGIDLSLFCILFQPFAKGVGAREINQLYLGSCAKVLPYGRRTGVRL